MPETTTPAFDVQRLVDQPIVAPDETIGHNINGPSLIRVPDWVANPLGRYYLYFAHHRGTHIRLAYADALEGPWHIHQPGVMDLDDSGMTGHLASPDVHVDHDNRQIRMYYHGNMPEADQPPEQNREINDKFYSVQRTRVALSSDGLRFGQPSAPLAGAYLRVFQHAGWHFALAMPGLLYRSPDGLSDFEFSHDVFLGDTAGLDGLPVEQQIPRHSAVQVRGDELRVFHSRFHMNPEHIMVSRVPLSADWHTWRAGEPRTVLAPERDWEGADCPPAESRRGAVADRVRQLRDPAIFEEAGETYLIYAIAGEAGLGIARLR